MPQPALAAAVSRAVSMATLLVVATAAAAPPPAPGPDTPIIFSAGFSNAAVFQRSATDGVAVYGYAPTSRAVTVTVSGHDVSYTVNADVSPWAGPFLHPATGPEPDHGQFVWRAILHPQPSAGGSFSVTAADGVANHTATISNVTYGDVFFCSGQSNMALETFYTYSADTLKSEVKEGKFANLRHFMFGSMGGHYEATEPQWVTAYNAVTPADNSTYVWHTLPESAAVPSIDNKTKQHSAFAQFSATCMYFGVELIAVRVKLGIDADVPVGLIQSAIGGSQIESWMDNETLTKCSNESLTGGAIPQDSGALFYGMVAPFANYSVAGWTWYQGENNVYGDMGNVALGAGYGCELPAMVNNWRRVWRAPETALFGVATLASGGSEGNGHHMSGMRWSQTANYGVLPAPAMPNSFLAQVYDLGDPWADMGDQHGAQDPNNCTLPPYGPKCAPWNPSSWALGMKPYAADIRKNSPSGIPGVNFMGGIHPRLKRPVGARLAAAAAAQMYPKAGLAVSGPTISGCALNQADNAVGAPVLTVKFNATLLGAKGDRVTVRPFDTNTSSWSGVDSSSLMVCAEFPKPQPPAKPLTCEQKCAAAGHCCTGIVSCNQQPSCSQGCAVAAVTPSLEACQAQCKQVPNHCTYKVGNLSLQTCAGCCDWTASNPAPPGLSPFAKCSPSSPGECMEGCAYFHGAAPAPLFPEINETTCGCQTWGTVPCDGGVKGQTNKWPCDPYNRTGSVFWYCEDGPGWKPPRELRIRGRELDRQRSLRAADALRAGLDAPQAPQNPFEAIWTSAPVLAGKDGASVDVDLSHLAPGSKVHAVRYAWPLGDQGDTCCPQETVTGATTDRIAPCVPASCPILSEGAQLPANPFFARVTEAGKCQCEAPQVCDA